MKIRFALLLLAACVLPNAAPARAASWPVIEEGKKVHVLILSYGEKTHPWLKANVTKTMRAEETYNADSIIGCTSAFTSKVSYCKYLDPHGGWKRNRQHRQ